MTSGQVANEVNERKHASSSCKSDIDTGQINIEAVAHGSTHFDQIKFARIVDFAGQAVSLLVVLDGDAKLRALTVASNLGLNLFGIVGSTFTSEAVDEHTIVLLLHRAGYSVLASFTHQLK